MEASGLDPRLVTRLRESTPARAWVLETLAAAWKRPDRATSALRTASREARKLRSRERRALWDVVYTLIRRRDAYGRGDWPGTLDAWLDGPPAETDDAALLGCPPGIAAELRELYGEALHDWLEASNARAPATLRVNVARTSREQLAEALARSDIQTRPVGAWGLEVDGRANLVGHPTFRRGHFELQDLASQRVAALVEGETVLDLCAGAGGKSLALAALGKRVTAADVRASALDELRRRAKRAGVRIEVRELPDGRLEDRRFASVLVDAPCSGSGVWRRHPEFRWRLGEAALAEVQRLQHMLIRKGAHHVQPGGQLVYATCSVLPRENEAVVEAFLADAPDWARVEADFRSHPHVDETDGMYAAVLTRQ